MKKYLTVANILMVAIICALVVNVGAKAAEAGPLLVFDQFNEPIEIARRYRVIDGLRVSGSGQFSSEELKKLITAIPTEPSNIWIVDLRQESHGFVNGIPVSWYADYNAGNKGKTAAQALETENALLSGLKKQNVITVHKLVKLSAGKVTAHDPTELSSRNIQSEQELVQSMGAKYKRMYVLDYNRPSDAEVDVFVDFMQTEYQVTDWLHFHCRGGKGRSSTFIAMYAIILNARNQTFDQIMQHQAEMGNTPLTDIPKESSKVWKSATAQARLQFLREFYQYASDLTGYPQHTWSQWLALKQAPK